MTRGTPDGWLLVVCALGWALFLAALALGLWRSRSRPVPLSKQAGALRELGRPLDERRQPHTNYPG